MGMFCNGANCDIYIGKGAGKMLMNDIRNAKKSVKVVSPYLSPSLISELIKFRKRNLEIGLVTTDNIEDFKVSYERNINQLIIQNRDVDYDAIYKREKWKNLALKFSYVAFGILTVLMGVGYYTRDLQVALGLIPVGITILTANQFKRKVKKTRIYSYWYSQLFPFKVFMTKDFHRRTGTFIHSKIYLIDDKIAYLGSLNFTSSGTKYNYETRVRTEDPVAVQQIKNEVYHLMNHAQLPERDLQHWGKQLYSEPIN